VTTHLKIRELARNLLDQNEQLQSLTNELQKTNTELVKVSDELRHANTALSQRAVQLETSNRVGQQVTSILDLGELLTEVTELIRTQFDFYFVGVWLLYEPNDRLVLQACTGGDSQLLEQEHFLTLNSDDNVITHVCQSTSFYLVDDVQKENLYLSLVELPESRSQLALPLRIGDETIGVLDIQSEQPVAFCEDNQKVLQTLANQIAIAIRNVRLYEMERKINADKDKFFSIMSHDLRGPFTSLLGNAQLMLSMAEELSADDVRHMSSAILNGAKSALSLLDNLLTWSRMQRGALDFFAQQLSLNILVQQTIDLLKQMAADKNIDLENAVDDELVAFADKNMVDTVIRNLASNALKFTPRGGSVIISAQQQISSNGKCPKLVQISVMDTGVGMESDDMDKLFRLDTNHSTPGTEKEQGTGLGLIICKEMVEQNGGQIWMESEAGKGTNVQFTLPVPEI
jgi:signal transduction histidine kinase